MSAPGSRRWFRLGTLAILGGGLGHFATVDLGTLWLRTSISRIEPEAALLDTMHAATLTFDALGSTSPFLAWAGMSLWTAASLALFSACFWMISREPAVPLRPFVRFAIALTVAFVGVSAPCFIWPATAGGLLAFALFVTSAIVGES